MFLNLSGNVVPFRRRYPGCPQNHAHVTLDIVNWTCQVMWTCTQNDVSPTPMWNCECYWKSIGLEIRLHKQVTHTQRHMNNAWSEMVFSTPCLALYSSWSPWLVQTIWDNSSPTTDQPCRLITTLLFLVLYFYDYEQPNAPLPTFPLCE